MDESTKQEIDLAISIVSPSFLDYEDVIQAQKLLILSVSDTLKDESTTFEVRDYIFRESMKLLRQLFEKESKNE